MTEPRSDLWSTGPGPDPAAAAPTVTRAAPATRGPAHRGRSRTPWWLWAVIALLAVAALALGLTRCGAQRDATEAPAAPAPPAAGTPAAPPAAGSERAPGSVTAGSTSLFDAARAGDRGLVALVGQTATGHAVPVQSVVADEGFWIGPGETDRVWVQLTSNEESAITITAGQLLDLAGPVVSHGADFARKAGVTAEEGAEQLTRQGAHLEVDPNQVKVVGTR